MDDVAQKYNAYAYAPTGKLTVDLVCRGIRGVLLY